MGASAITGNLTGSVTEDTTLQVTGLVSVEPVDTSASFVAGSFEGQYGTLTVIASGDWQYALDNAFGGVQSLAADAAVHDQFVVSWGGVLSGVVDITVHGNNDPASFEGDISRTLNITTADHVSGQVLVSDVDTGEKEIRAATGMQGVVGTFSIAADGVWRYDLLPGKQITLIDEKKSLVETFQVVSKDGSRVDVSIQVSLTDAQPTKSILGTNGADTLSGSAGNDTIDGGAGTDTVVYSGNRSSFAITKTSAGFGLTDNTGAAGTDTLLNVERVKFSDGGIALDVGATQPAGETVLLLGAVLPGRLVFDATKQGLLGAAIDLFDQGYSLQTLSGAVMRLPIWDILTGKATPSNTDIATYLLTNVNGAAPVAATLANAVTSLNTETDFASQGNFLWHLAESAANQTRIDLVGLAATGLAYGV